MLHVFKFYKLRAFLFLMLHSEGSGENRSVVDKNVWILEVPALKSYLAPDLIGSRKRPILQRQKNAQRPFWLAPAQKNRIASDLIGSRAKSIFLVGLKGRFFPISEL